MNKTGRKAQAFLLVLFTSNRSMLSLVMIQNESKDNGDFFFTFVPCILILSECIIHRPMHKCGPGSVVGIASSYRLDGPGIESRWGRDFPHLSRPALGPTPASCTMGTGSFPGVKGGRGVTLTPHPLLVSLVMKE